jgi:hypothetical protein
MAGQLQVSRGGTPIFVEDFLRNSNTSNQIARQTQKTLSQLSKTNNEIARSQRAIEEHTARIAAATERQNDISLRQLAEAERQTAISEQQLEMTKIADLERRRQIELKQAAFALKEALAAPHSDPDIQRFYNLYVSRGVVQAMDLTADAAHEIADKEYIRDVLRALEDEFLSLAEQLGQDVQNDIERYVDARNKLSAINAQLAAIEFGDSSLTDPGEFSFKDLIIKSLYPIPLKHGQMKSESEYRQAMQFSKKVGLSYDIEEHRRKDQEQAGKPNILGNVVFGPIWIACVIASGGIFIIGSALFYLAGRFVRKENVKKADEKNANALSKQQKLLADKNEAERFITRFEGVHGTIVFA